MQKIDRIVIVDLPSPRDLGAVFADLIVALVHTLTASGVKVEYSRRLYRTSDPVIVFGFYRLFINKPLEHQLPKNYFIFNLAPIYQGKLGWFDAYIDYLGRQPSSIDYSYLNVDKLDQKRSLPGSVHLFKFGYFNLFPHSGFLAQDSFVFYGSLNPIRLKRLNDFKKAGIKIEILENTWGLERDIQVHTARAVINIGKYQPNILEVYRLWHSLCLGAPLMSDAGADARLVADYQPYVRIFDQVQPEHLGIAPISAAVYRAETQFSHSVNALLAFMQERCDQR